MRAGLIGQARRVWAPRGVKVRQVLERRYEWARREVMVALDAEYEAGGGSGSCAGVAGEGLRVLIWNRAPAHRSRRVKGLGVALLEQPAYSPELNSAEWVFEELRRVAEGRVYGSLEEKQVKERALEQLARDAERVRRLTDWS